MTKKFYEPVETADLMRACVENDLSKAHDYCSRCGFHFYAHGAISTACPDGKGLYLFPREEAQREGAA